MNWSEANGENIPLRNDWERKGSEVRSGIDIVRDTEGVVELICIDQLESERRVG